MASKKDKGKSNVTNVANALIINLESSPIASPVTIAGLWPSAQNLMLHTLVLLFLLMIALLFSHRNREPHLLSMSKYLLMFVFLTSNTCFLLN